jgi:hypothetical protein
LSFKIWNNVKLSENFRATCQWAGRICELWRTAILFCCQW